MSGVDVLYSFVYSGDPVDLSSFFLTPGVAVPGLENPTWQLIVTDESTPVWYGGINSDGSLNQGNAPANFIYDGPGTCNNYFQLQALYEFVPFVPDPSMCDKCLRDASGQTSAPASPTSPGSVELATGRFVFQKELMAVAGLGAGSWHFGLNYKADFNIDSILGKNFAFPQYMYLQQIATDSSPDILLITNQLTHALFNNNDDDVYSPAAGNNSGGTLVASGSGTSERFIFTAPNGTVTTFWGFECEWPGQVESIVDHYGNSQALTWGSANHIPQLLSVTDAYDRAVTYDYYGAEGGYRLKQITDFDGRQLNFQYDALDHLVAVITPSILKAAPGNTFPDGTAYVFQYDIDNTDPIRRDDLIKIWYPNQTQEYVQNRSVDVDAVYAKAKPRYRMTYGQSKNNSDTYGKVLTETLGDSEKEIGGTATFDYITCPDDLPTNLIDPLAPPPSDPPPPDSPVYGGCPIVSRTIYTDRNGNCIIYDFGASINYVWEDPDWVETSTPNWTVSRLEVQLNRDKNSLELDNEDNGGVATPPFVTWTKYNAQNQPLTVVYPEGNSVEYTYDTGIVDPDADPGTVLNPYIPRVGLLLSETRLPGNSLDLPSRDGSNGQTRLTKSYFYEPIYNRLCAVVDERGNPIDVVDETNVYFTPQNDVGDSAPPSDADHSRYATIYTFDYQKDDLGTITGDATLRALLGLDAGQIEAVIDYVSGQMAATDGTGGLPAFLPNTDNPTGLGDINGDGTGSGTGINASHLGNKIQTILPAVWRVGDTDTPQARYELYTVNLRGQITTTTDPEGNLTVVVRFSENDPEGSGQSISGASGTQQYGLVREVHRDANPDDVMSLVGASGDLVDFTPNETLIPRNNTSGVYQDLVTRYEGSSTGESGCVTCGYDAMGNILNETDPRGFTTIYDRNELGEIYRLTSSAPYNFQVETYYDSNRNIIRVDKEDRQVQYNSSDPTDASYGTFTPTGSGTAAHVPMISGPGGILRPGWFSNLMCYDILDNKIEDDIDATGSIPANLITKYEYDANQNLIKIVKPEGNTVEYDYDERNLKIAERIGYNPVDPITYPGSVTIYSYDGNGNSIYIVGPVVRTSDPVTVEIADAFNLGSAITYTGDPLLLNSYDGFNRIIKATNALGTYSDLTYDPTSNLIQKQISGKIDLSSSGELANTILRYDEARRIYEEQRDVFVIEDSTDISTRTITYTGGGLATNSTANDHTATVYLTGTTPIGSSYVLSRNIYDRSGRITTTKADNTAETTYAYDGANRQISSTDPKGNIIATDYDGNGNPVKITRTDVCTITTPTVPNETFVSFAWFDCLNRPVVTGAQGADGQLTSNLNLCCPWQGLPSTLFSLLGYDSRGNRTTVTDPKGNVVVSIYDGASRLIETQQEMRLNGDGRSIPAANQTFLTAGGGIIRTEYLYDGNSRLIELVDDRGGSTIYDYDLLDRLVTRTLADGSTSLRSYNAFGSLTGYTDENGSVFVMLYDGVGNKLFSTITPASGVGGTTDQQFRYDGLSRMVSAQDNGGSSPYALNRFFYDSLSRVLEERQYFSGHLPPLFNTTKTKWVSLVPTEITYPNSDITMTNEYDELYRRTSVIGASATSGTFDTVDWEFFGRGRAVETNYGDSSLIMTQMNNARTHSAVQSGVALPAWGDQSSDRLGYDGAGRLITKRYLTGGIDEGTGAYNATAALVGHMTSHDRAGNKLYERHLEAESRSHLYQPFNDDGSFAVGYDSANRLAQYQRGILSSTTIPYRVGTGASITTPITLPGTDQERSYGLDGLGNWKTTDFTSVDGDGETSTTHERRQHNYVNAITSYRDTTEGYSPFLQPFEYDHGNNTGAAAQQGNGNLANDGLRLYQYDALNRLIQVSKVTGDDTSEVLATYRYDALNRRVQKVIADLGGGMGGMTGDVPAGTFGYYYLGRQIIEERDDTDADANAWIKLNFWGRYIDELLFLAVPGESAPVTYRVLSDLMYRSVALVTTGNAITEAYDCAAYGKTLCYSGPGTDGDWFTDDDVTTDTPINTTIFTGRQFEPDTKLYYFRGRFYSQGIGRFVNRDPIGYRAGLNLYAYCSGNPVNRLDPLGTFGAATTSFVGTVVTQAVLGPPPSSDPSQPAPVSQSYDPPPGDPGSPWNDPSQTASDPTDPPPYYDPPPGDPGSPWNDPSSTWNPNQKYSQQEPCPLKGQASSTAVSATKPQSTQAVIGGPITAFIHYILRSGTSATYGGNLLTSLQNLEKGNPNFIKTKTPINLTIYDYGSFWHPYDTLNVALSLGQFRYTSNGSTINISDTYAFPFSQDDHAGGTTYHNAQLSWIPGVPYNNGGTINN